MSVDKKFRPMVVFKDAPIDQEAELLFHFSQDSRWAAVFDASFPDLKTRLAGVKGKEDALSVSRVIIQEKRQRSAEQIDRGRKSLDAEWQSLGGEFLDTLASHMETEWPKDKETIIGYTTVLPVYPRFFDSYSFYVGYKNVADNRETVAHEILHFLWFKKWQEVFPDAKKEEFEAPHLAWRLSEVMDPIILQCHPRLNELVHPKNWGYPSFGGLYIGEKTMMQYFVDIYREAFARKDRFDFLLERLWTEAQRHQDILGRF